MTAPPATSYRLEVKVPMGGWLSSLLPHEAMERLELYAAWYDSASLVAAGLKDLGQVVADVEFPRSCWSARSVFRPEDLRMSWNPVRQAAADAGIDAFRDRLSFGRSMADVMVVTFWEVRRA